MCGIAGAVDLRGLGRVPAPDVVDRMTDALAHRGPDGRGVWRSANAALGHRRLAIIEPTPAGAQPMIVDGVAITFNGEIYNFKELRRELEGQGQVFRAGSDTEVLLRAYRVWGKAMVPRLNGIFAFCIVDGPRVLLARDHAGIKPLFIAVHDGVLRFGSEIKAILADPTVRRAPDLKAVDAFLSLAWVPSPLSPFEGIEQLPPATMWSVEIGSGNAPVVETFWRPTVAERPLSMNAALDELGQRLHRAVQMQMVADVPLGAFLSGGLDSASIVAEMVRLTTDPVRTFSIGFTEASYDEREGAAHTARILGTRHQADVVDLDLRGTVLDLARTNDDLLADSSMLAVDHLCRVTRQHVTVALSGDGADEILAGYPTYPATYAARVWRQVPGGLRTLARRAFEKLPPSTERYNPRDFALRFMKGAERGAGLDFASWRIYLDEEAKAELCSKPLPDGDALGRYARAEGTTGTLLKRMLIGDFSHYLPSDMLVKVDRASMRHALEVRVPFLDHTFVDFALSLPSSLLLSPRGTKKRILRRHVEQRVSPETAHRKKRGFNVPVGDAFKGPLYDLLLDAVRSEPFASDGPLNAAAVERWASEHRAGQRDAGHALYAVLTLALWWRSYLQV